jgi:hypothetical protein
MTYKEASALRTKIEQVVKTEQDLIDLNRLVDLIASNISSKK